MTNLIEVRILIVDFGDMIIELHWLFLVLLVILCNWDL